MTYLVAWSKLIHSSVSFDVLTREAGLANVTAVRSTGTVPFAQVRRSHVSRVSCLAMSLVLCRAIIILYTLYSIHCTSSPSTMTATRRSCPTTSTSTSTDTSTNINTSTCTFMNTGTSSCSVVASLIFFASLVATSTGTSTQPCAHGRISKLDYILTQDQIDTFFRDGLVTIPNVLTQDELIPLERAFDRFMNGEIKVPDKDFCDMSKPFGTPREEWSIINAMLPTKYDASLQNNSYELITKSIVDQLFPTLNMTKDYDQLLNKLPAKPDAVFAWHQDMGYWPGSAALGVDTTATATFSLAIDDSNEENGCLRYVVGSGASKSLRPHVPLAGSRDEGHALTIEIGANEEIRLAPAARGSLTIHDEYVVHGSGGNNSPVNQRRTYVLAYRAGVVVQAERTIGFTHSHNDEVNWDTFHDGETHRIKVAAQEARGATTDEL